MSGVLRGTVRGRMVELDRDPGTEENRVKLRLNRV